MMRKSALVPIVILASVALFAACGSTSSSKGKTTEPTVDQPGRTLSRSRDQLLDVIVDYKFANLSQGDNWMILNVAVTSSESQAIEVRREHVLVRTPDGRKIPLPPYADFIKAYPEIQSAARRAALASDPIDFTQAGRRTCYLGFQPLPGTVAALESVFVNMRTRAFSTSRLRAASSPADGSSSSSSRSSTRGCRSRSSGRNKHVAGTRQRTQGETSRSLISITASVARNGSPSTPDSARGPPNLALAINEVAGLSLWRFR
jgi:predicted small secreted protein